MPGILLATDDVLKQDWHSLWVQPLGPGTPMTWLGNNMYDMADLVEPRGDFTLTQVHDTSSPEGWRILGDTETPPDAVTTSVTGFRAKQRQYLTDLLNCRMPFYVTVADCGDKADETNYHRVYAVRRGMITQRSRTKMGNRLTKESGEAAYDLKAWWPVYDLSKLAIQRVAAVSTNNLVGIRARPGVVCADSCGAASPTCQVMGKCDSGAVGVIAHLYQSVNRGQTWVQAAADPFIANEIMHGPVYVQLAGGTWRIIVARGTADGGPLDISYSDDNGATWTGVALGATVGEFCPSSQALVALDRYNIWCGGSAGHIYFSADGGLTWVASDTGTIAANVRSIWPLDVNRVWACGDGDDIAICLNHAGLRTWAAAATGSAAQLNTICAIDSTHIWCGTNTGVLYRSVTGGVTGGWAVVGGWAGAGAGVINHVTFQNELIGWMAHNTAAPVGRIFRTWNGGQTWELFQTTFVNAGLTMLLPCDHNGNLVWGVGMLSGGTAMCVKAAG